MSYSNRRQKERGLGAAEAGKILWVLNSSFGGQPTDLFPPFAAGGTLRKRGQVSSFSWATRGFPPGRERFPRC